MQKAVLLVQFLMMFFGINYTTNLIAGQDIYANSVFVLIFRIILVLFALYILKRVLISMSGGKKRKKKKNKKKKKKTTNKNSNNSGSSLYRFKY